MGGFFILRLKLKDLYTIKHALELDIRLKQKLEGYDQDISHEKILVDKLVFEINKIQPTKAHYE